MHPQLVAKYPLFLHLSKIAYAKKKSIKDLFTKKETGLLQNLVTNYGNQFLRQSGEIP
jgi:hypothetical protein